MTRTISAFLTGFVIVFSGITTASSYAGETADPVKEPMTETIRLPEPEYDSDTSVEEAIRKRRSVRRYSGGQLSLSEVSQLLWSAQGITGRSGLRTAPSAGALYPLEVYLVSGNVADLPAGVYVYRPEGHELLRVTEGDRRADLSGAALGQPSVKNAAAVIVFSAVFERVTVKYGGRGIYYVYMECGHAAQNVLLQAVSLDLGAVVMGAFHEQEVKKVLKVSGGEQPLYIVPVGRK